MSKLILPTIYESIDKFRILSDASKSIGIFINVDAYKHHQFTIIADAYKRRQFVTIANALKHWYLLNLKKNKRHTI